MKKSFYIIILLGLFLCSLLNSFAQEKVVTEQELNNLEKIAWKKMKDKSYRVTVTFRRYKNVSDSLPNYPSKEVLEYVPPDRKREVREASNEKGTTRTERISIGQKKYIKENNEDWRELQPSKVRMTVQGDRMEDKKTVEVRYKGQTKVKNQSADLYEKQTTIEYESGNGRTTTVFTSIERFWFGKNGFFLKREFESKKDSEENSSHTILEYDYDSKIKIEAPIVKLETKQNPK